VLGYLNVRWPEIAWQTEYPHLKAYWENLERRESFKETRPEVQVINDRIV
jgi:glutathione S-transferase